MIKTGFRILACAILILTGCSKPANQIVLAGGFTKGDEKGLALFQFDPTNGKMELMTEFDGGPSPTLFCFSEKRDLVYVIDEVSDFKGEKAGGITTFKVNPDYTFEKAGEIAVPYGGPCFISISKDAHFLFVASYASGSVAVARLGKDGIPVSITDTIQYASPDSLPSHPHMIAGDPLSRRLYLTDLGLDRVMVYNLDTASGKINRMPFQELHVPKGSGPRHFSFSKNGSRMYLINEPGSTVMCFNVTDGGALEQFQTIRTTDEGYTGKNQCAEITISNDGKFLYGSNRGENSIVVFKIADDGRLTLSGHSTCGGDWPRNFILDPTGKYLISGNQKSGDIAIFSINPSTGIPEGPKFKVPMKEPAFLEFVK
jgi:6-phosphogluconolactonase